MLQVSNGDPSKPFDPAAMQILGKVVMACGVGRRTRLSSFLDIRPSFLDVDENGTGAFPNSSAEHTVNLMKAIRVPGGAVGEIFKLVLYRFDCFSQLAFTVRSVRK